MIKQEVIYILGVERSGTTLFNIALGVNEEIASFGELQYFPESVIRNYLAYQDTNILESTFWLKIIAEFKKKFGEQVFEDYQKLKLKYERFRNLPLIGFHFLIKHPSLKKYWDYNYFLFHILTQIERKKYICDSSKNPIRCISLSLSKSFNIRPILITRSVYGYCWSKKRISIDNNQITSISKSALFWSFNNMILFVLHIFLHSSIRIKYESFAQSPMVVLKTLEQKMKISFAKTKSILRENKVFFTNNMIAGNMEVRKKTTIKLKFDNSWKENLTRTEIRKITILSFLVLKTLGYETNTRS